MSKKSKRVIQKQTAPRRPVWLILGGVALVGVAVLLFVSSTPSAPKAEVEVTGAPSLKPDKEKVDLGDVKLGQTVNVMFEIANVGDRQLQFLAKPYIEVVEGC